MKQALASDANARPVVPKPNNNNNNNNSKNQIKQALASGAEAQKNEKIIIVKTKQSLASGELQWRRYWQNTKWSLASRERQQCQC